MYRIILQVFATLCKRSLILLTSGMGGDGWAGKGNTQGARKEMITLDTRVGEANMSLKLENIREFLVPPTISQFFEACLYDPLL